MGKEGKKCVLYPRVSTEMQVDGFSLDAQKNKLMRYAEREEMQVVNIYEDAGKSGKSIEGRPSFKRMLSDIENGLEIDYILVYKLSRFGRNAADILSSIEFVQSYGVNLICTDEGIDSSQATGKLLISVLSAVSEIERENIIEQTMNGRKEKARQGGWNGGFAPYGYYLEDGNLFIQENEALAVRIIFDKFVNENIGFAKIAKLMNLQGIEKVLRHNGRTTCWTSAFVNKIIDNPVYAGKIAFGRRAKEKIKGTRDDYRLVKQDNYILSEGKHEAIIDEILWEAAKEKRLLTGVANTPKIGRDRVHLLSGILRCPKCKGAMYVGKKSWVNANGDTKENFYYHCTNAKSTRGRLCSYQNQLNKKVIEPLIISAIRDLIKETDFSEEIRARIGSKIDVSSLQLERANYQVKLNETLLNKSRLETEIDNLPLDAKYRERKLADMTSRLDSLYDVIAQIEYQIQDVDLRIKAVEEEKLTLDNIYSLLNNFDILFDKVSQEEKRSLISSLIKEIEIFPKGESDFIVKSILFRFPLFFW